ncbi:hypothetical protein AN480_29395 [Mycobacterium intracellulare subsp. chimaera]|nr:hypothetical protein AN480_29395 [Mycobacterium intracellulare subsp. chimaera]
MSFDKVLRLEAHATGFDAVIDDVVGNSYFCPPGKQRVKFAAPDAVPVSKPFTQFTANAFTGSVSLITSRASAATGGGSGGKMNRHSKAIPLMEELATRITKATRPAP